LNDFAKGYKNIPHIGLYERMNQFIYRSEKNQLLGKVEKRQHFEVFLQSR